jgi:hypothetical protein
LTHGFDYLRPCGVVSTVSIDKGGEGVVDGGQAYGFFLPRKCYDPKVESYRKGLKIFRDRKERPLFHPAGLKVYKDPDIEYDQSNSL